MKRRGEKGVTLIEIAVVMAIVAIMGVFMAPAIGEWIGNYRIRQAARDIASTLQEAKMQTIAERTTLYRVDFSATNDTYQLLPGGSLTHVPRGVDIETGSAASVSFSPDGTSPSGTSTITVKNEDGKQYDVTVNSVGRISIQEG